MKINNLKAIQPVVGGILSTEGQQANELRTSKDNLSKPPSTSSRFESLQAELIRLRPDLTREDIVSLVSQKKSKVGGGFLTDQGALFLVASDLGVTLKPALARNGLPSKIPTETDESSLYARILSISPPKILQKKEPNSQPAFVLKVVCYNSASTIFVNIWDYSTASNFIKSNFAPGDGIEIKGAYSRRALNDSDLALSLSSQGQVLSVDQKSSLVAMIPTISERIVDLGKLVTIPPNKSTVVSARVASAVRTSEFRRKDGATSRYVSFSLAGKEKADSPEKSSEARVVIWDSSNPIFEKLRMGEVITLLNVKPKMSEYLGTQNLELHGDETTEILEHWNETKVWIEGRLGIVRESAQKLGSLKYADSTAQRVLPFIARVLSAEQSLDNEWGNSSPLHLLLIDSSKRKIALTVQDGAIEDCLPLRVDDVIVCKPESFDQTVLKAICKAKGSIAKVKPERNDIPRSSMLAVEIAKLEPNSIANIDCMVLSITPTRDIETKEGLVKRSEALLADPSGEIRMYAWRNLSRHLDKLSPGDRILIRACEIQSHEGKKFALFKNYSRIESQN
jgi:hypothetical protein